MRHTFSILLVLLAVIAHAQIDSVSVLYLNNVNSNEDDFSPVFLDSTTLLFTSSRVNPKVEKIVTNFHDIYIAESDSSDWPSAEILTYQFNSDDHEVCVGISSDQSQMYIYKTFSGGDIYFTNKKDDGKWGFLKKLPCNTLYNESSATIYNDTMYFVSNRPGGKGGYDIYRKIKQTIGWTAAENLESINTEADENYVSVSKDGKCLYFSSNSSESMGGYDIFKVEISANRELGVVENMVLANSVNNDICFTQQGIGLFCFASDRIEQPTTGYNLFSYRQYHHVRDKEIFDVPIEVINNSTIETTGKGKVVQKKWFVKVECYKEFLPEKVILDKTEIIDSLDKVVVGDIIINSKVTVLDSSNTDVLVVEMNTPTKKEDVVVEAKEPERTENLSLEQIKAQIDFDIAYCQVQYGAFYSMRTMETFIGKYPLLEGKVVKEVINYYTKFMYYKRSANLDDAAIIQKKSILEYQSSSDSFIGVYGNEDQRVAIYFDIETETYILLKP